jgi:succinoglycan biosynthesis protein ExoO
VGSNPGLAATVSVVIPAYNAAEFLARAVRSALDQTYPVSEIIIVDDGSNDDTVKVARALELDDGRIKLIELGTNGGPSKARNAAIANAKSDWIAVLDADDAYLPERLATMLAVTEGADIVADNMLYYDAKKGTVGLPGARRTTGSETIDLLTFADARRDHEDFGLFQPMFRRAFLERHGLTYPEDLRHGEDFQLMVEALAKGAVFRLSWVPTYLYTTRHSGWSRTSIDYRRVSATLKALTQRDDLNLSPAVRAKLRDRAAVADDLHLREQVKEAIRNRALLRALALSVSHPVIWKFGFDKARRYFGRI